MSTNIFSGLEELGFHDIDKINLFNKEQNKEDKQEMNEITKEKSLLYDREVICPVCDNKFKARAVKTSSYRIEKKESDFFIRYAMVNPYFYDVWICNSCGYTAMKADFEKIRKHQIPSIKEKVTRRWQGREYPDTYDVQIAIQRYKLALLNYFYMEAPSSKKAMTCLKIAWMYRLLEDSSSETAFLKQSLEGFMDSYLNEDFPQYGMDSYTTMYLIGELHRKVENYEEALSWFSKLITTATAPQKIKDMARDQKDLIKVTSVSEEMEEEHSATEKESFFSKLFKKH